MQLEKASTHVFRMMGIYEDETAFILPLQTAAAASSDARMLSVSTREPLVLVGADNTDALRRCAAFAAVEQRCTELVRAYMTSIHVLLAAPDTDALARGNQLLKDTQNLRADESPTAHDDNVDEYDEIDDIYRYVRQGGEPPSPRSPLIASAADTAADSSPDIGRQQSATATHHAAAADYNWEEPIYEDIEKIRQRKRQRATTTEATTTATTTTTMTGDDDKQASIDVIPIGNLRQLIKRFSMLESPTSSKTRPAARRLDRTPPVPPKLTVDMAVSGAPAGPHAAQRQQADTTTTRRPSRREYVEDQVSIELDDDVRRQSSSEHVDRAAPGVCQARVQDARTGCVTSVRVSRDAGRRQQLHDASSPYFCSRVSVGAGSTMSASGGGAQQPAVTRITTLSRGSARHHDVHQQTA